MAMPGVSAGATDRFVRLGTRAKATLGEGAYGKVVPALDQCFNRLVALKIQPATSDTAFRELAFFSKIKDSQEPPKHIVEMYAADIEGDTLRIALEYMSTTLGYAWTRAHGFLDEDLCERYSLHLLAGLEELHVRDIAHRDIGMENCLLDARGNTLKITVLGFSVYSGASGKRVA
jgi:mitogen-activated protein kinase kinase kinase